MIWSSRIELPVGKQVHPPEHSTMELKGSYVPLQPFFVARVATKKEYIDGIRTDDGEQAAAIASWKVRHGEAGPYFYDLLFD